MRRSFRNWQPQSRNWRERMEAARLEAASLAAKQHSELIVAAGPYLEDFIGELFGISAELKTLEAASRARPPLYSVKRRFVQRKALTGIRRKRRPRSMARRFAPN